MHLTEGEIEQQWLGWISISVGIRDDGHRFVREQLGGIAAMAFRICVLGSVAVGILHTVQPPVRHQPGGLRNWVQERGRIMREGINDAILAVVQFPATIEGPILVAFLDHSHRLSVDDLVADVVLGPAAVPLSGDEGLITSGIERLRHDVLAQVKAARVVHARADSVASRVQTGTSHTAHCRRIEALHADAGRGEAVHVRCVNVYAPWIGVIADVRPALVIREDDEDVGRSAGRQSERIDSSVPRIVSHGSGEVVGANRRRCAAKRAGCTQCHSWRKYSARHTPSVAGARAARCRERLRVAGAGKRVGQRIRRDGQRRDRGHDCLQQR